MQREGRAFNSYTKSALEDELAIAFLGSKRNGRFYYAQAEFYLRRINVYRPVPIFILYPNDIPEELTIELKNLKEVTRNRIFTNVVRRIYESIDEKYFHTNGIYGKVKWHMLEETNQ